MRGFSSVSPWLHHPSSLLITITLVIWSHWPPPSEPVFKPSSAPQMATSDLQDCRSSTDCLSLSCFTAQNQKIRESRTHIRSTDMNYWGAKDNTPLQPQGGHTLNTHDHVSIDPSIRHSWGTSFLARHLNRLGFAIGHSRQSSWTRSIQQHICVSRRTQGCLEFKSLQVLVPCDFSLHRILWIFHIPKGTACSLQLTGIKSPCHDRHNPKLRIKQSCVTLSTNSQQFR